MIIRFPVTALLTAISIIVDIVEKIHLYKLDEGQITHNRIASSYNIYSHYF